jgi:hypothetical protein
MEKLAKEWQMVEERRSAMIYIWFTSRFTRKRQEIDNAANCRQREPLEHPELSRMTLRELADLPMPAYTLEARTCGIRII